MKKAFFYLIGFILFVIIFSWLLWYFSPDHESPFLYACEHHTMDENICDGVHDYNSFRK